MKKYEYNYGKNSEGILSTISGYATETTNFGETAFGILNKSTRDKGNFTTPEVVSSSTATLFSVGNGTDHNSRKNIIELKADGSTFINGVGGYDGTNSDSATSLSDTLQNISSGIEGDYLPLTGGEITGNLIINMGPDGVNNGDAYVEMINSNGAWRCGLVNKQDALVGNLSRGFEATMGEYNVELGMIQTNSDNMPKLIIDAFTSKLEMDTKGITISNKSSSDLLNAGGSTTSVSDIVTQIQAAIVDQAPETLDTLNELAAALGDDPNFATTITNQIAQKADRTVATSSTDGLMSASDKTKLDSLSTNTNHPANLDVFTSVQTLWADDGSYVTLQFNKNNTLTGESATETGSTLYVANQESSGFMSAADKTKLDQITITEGDIVASGFRITDGTANEVLTADGDSNTLKTINGQTLLGSGDVDMSEFATQEDVADVTNQLAQKADKTVATTSANGLMSSADKAKLDGIDTQNLATKSEVNTKISGTGVTSIQVVTALPDVQEEGVLYIVTGEEA